MSTQDAKPEGKGNIKMAEKIEVPTEEIIDEKVETPVEDKTKSKVFTQDELNKVVQNRLKSEQIKAKEQADNFASEKSALESTIKGYEAIIQKQVDALKGDIPENYKKLFDKLSVLEQYEFLNNPENKIAKKEIPITPKTTGKEEPPTPVTKKIKIF